MVTLNSDSLQGRTPGRVAVLKSNKQATLSRTPKCLLCNEFMLDGQKTVFRQIRRYTDGKPYTIAKRVHEVCADG